MCSYLPRRGGQNRSKNVETIVVLFAIAALFGLVGLVAIDSIYIVLRE